MMRAIIETALDDLTYRECRTAWHVLEIRIAARKATRRRNTLHEFRMDEAVVIDVVFHTLNKRVDVRLECIVSRVC